MTVDKIPQQSNDHAHYKELLYGLIVVNKFMRVVETGTDLGDSARIFSTALQPTNGKLLTIDIKPPLNNWIDQWPIKNITFHQGDSKLLKLSEEIDMLFLDAHTPEMDVERHVASELHGIGVWVRVGGKIVVDDVWHDVYGPPTRKALETFCRTHQCVWTYYPQGFGLAVIEVTHPLTRPEKINVVST